MTTSASVLERRAVSGVLSSDGAELAVHALAQLPDRVFGDVAVDRDRRPGLELLAAAYAIRDRVRFVSTSTGLNGPFADMVRERNTFAEIVESLYESADPPASLRYDDDIFRGQRIALVTNLPAHYRLPLFSAMASRLEQAGAVFRVLFMADRAIGRPWLTTESHGDFDRETLRSRALPVRDRPPLLPIDLGRRLAAFKPTLLLVGSFSPAVAVPVARLARRQGVPWGIWSGEVEGTKTARSRLRLAQRSALVRSADLAITYGHASAQYLRRLRPELPVVYGRNTAPVAGRPARTRRPTDALEALVIGDLASPRKGVDVALDALLRRPSLRCQLTVVGGGRLAAKLERRAEGDARIRFGGPLEPMRTQALIRAADVVLFPTRSDVFGLVLVEAMGAGVATVVSSSAGAVADLAVSGHNCLVIDGHEPEAWAEALSLLVEDHELRVSLGAAGANTVRRRWTIDHAADAMLAGFRLGLLRAGRR
jgi:glycosyltransferase involved in cell wall biosynthesis